MLSRTIQKLNVGAEPTTPSPQVRPDRLSRIGRYAVLRALGAGGMGVVYAAYDEELDRKVAVKLLRAAGPARPEQRTRVQREAQAMARVSHPNVVSVYEVGAVCRSARTCAGPSLCARWRAGHRKRRGDRS
jgi:serine/threonine-protein kinase